MINILRLRVIISHRAISRVIFAIISVSSNLLELCCGKTSFSCLLHRRNLKEIIRVFSVSIYSNERRTYHSTHIIELYDDIKHYFIKFIFKKRIARPTRYYRCIRFSLSLERKRHGSSSRATEGGLAPDAAAGAGAGTDGIVGGPRTPQQIASQKRLQATQAQVDEVVDIMKTNVEKVLERDQKLSELDDRAGGSTRSRISVGMEGESRERG